MTACRRFVIAAAVLAAALAAHTLDGNARPPGACDRDLMQLYAGGDRMMLRVPTVANFVEGLTTVRVYEAAWRKLAAHDLHDADATQWLDVKLHVGPTQYAMLLSLRRSTADLGYGLAGHIAVSGLGGGGSHDGNAERVIHRLLQHVDEVADLYAKAQSVCRR